MNFKVLAGSLCWPFLNGHLIMSGAITKIGVQFQAENGGTEYSE